MENIKILLVEDDEDQVELIKRVFNMNMPDIELLIASSIEKAKEVIGQHQDINLIISDLLLMDGKGIDILQYSTNKIPLMIMTCYGDDKTQQEALAKGAFAYLSKSDISALDIPKIAVDLINKWNIKKQNE